MSGLKINFFKSEVIMINGDDELALEYAEIFNCNAGNSLSSILEFQLAPVD
jgi:hypothetical protein